MKQADYNDYSSKTTDLCERALLSIWPHLGEVHQHIALVGGLVPRYLCKGQELEAQTLDVDFAISIAADAESPMQPLHWKLQSLGFEAKDGRYQKQSGNVTLLIDFLTEGSGGGIREISEIRASGFPGVNRAIQVTRNVPIKGVNLEGTPVETELRVCEAGPFLCLKLSAYAQRSEAKDIFDAIQVLQYYDKGIEAAAQAFHAEAGVNKAYPIARKAMQDHCQSPTAKGPMQYANFCLSAGTSKLSQNEFRFRQTQLANVAVTGGGLLIMGDSGTLKPSKG